MPPTAGAARSESDELIATRSAAREAFYIPELRQEIFRSLDKPDLVRCLRVSKMGLAAAAKELYHTVKYDLVQEVMDTVTNRQQIYLDAVVEVNARPLHLPPHILDQLEDVVPNLDLMRRHTPDALLLTKYHPRLFELVVPPLKRHCPNLRRILLGKDYDHHGGQSWIVYFHPSRTVTSSPLLEGTTSVPSGFIELFGRQDFYTLDTPQSTLPDPPPPAPSSRFPIIYRFDARLHPLLENRISPELLGLWASAMAAGPFDQLYRSINLRDVPLPLSALTSVYQRQVQAAYAEDERLRQILAEAVFWTAPDFHPFARIASRSLTHLVLRRDWQDDSHEADVLVSFSDLPSIIPTIKAELPNLLVLVIGLRGIETAERFCKDLLYDSILEERGSIKMLSIVTPPWWTPLFNTVRYLSQICRLGVNIAVNPYGHELWDEESQTQYLTYLRSHTSPLGPRLGSIDFLDLGITDPKLVPKLVLDKDGNPRRPVESKVAEWASLARADIVEATASLIPQLQSDLATCTEAFDRFEANAAGADNQQLVAEAEQMLQAAELARQTAQDIIGFKDAQLEEMRRYIEGLREAVDLS